MIEFFGIIAMTILFINAEPIIGLKRLVGLKEEEYRKWSKSKRTIWRFLDCALCLGFWFGILIPIIPFDLTPLYLAAITSVVAELLNKKLKSI